MIYFVACHEANAVKIGICPSIMNCLYARLSSMQSGCPFQLEVIGIDESGYLAEEQALHERFAEHRIRGEWFRLTDELQEHIAQFPKPDMAPRKRGGKHNTSAYQSRSSVATSGPLP